MRQRLELTQAWLDQLNPEIRPSIDTAMLEWWRNIRTDGGMGLSDVGYEWLTQELELPQWRYVIPHASPASMSLQRVLTLDRHCPCVYWFRSTSRDFQIAFFDSQQAMLFNLYGDLDRYLAMIRRG